MFSHLLCFLLVISLFSMAPKHSAGMVSSVAEDKNPMVRTPERTLVLGNFPSGMSYRAARHEAYVNQSAIYI